MNTIQNTTTKFALLAMAGGLLTILTGCGQTPAERAFMMRQQMLAAEASATSHELGAGSSLAGGHSLAAGDALGVALFEPAADNSSRLAFFRNVDRAVAIAEAHEANGTYDNWYASVTGGDTDTAIAGNEDDGSLTPDAIADINE